MDRNAAALALIDDAQSAIHRAVPRWLSLRLFQIGTVPLYAWIVSGFDHGTSTTARSVGFAVVVVSGLAGFAAELLVVDRRRDLGVRARVSRAPRLGRQPRAAMSATLLVYVATLAVAWPTGWWWSGFVGAALTLAAAVVFTRHWHASFAAPLLAADREIAAQVVLNPESIRAYEHAGALRVMAAVIIIDAVRIERLAELLDLPEGEAGAAIERLTQESKVFVDRGRGGWVGSVSATGRAGAPSPNSSRRWSARCATPSRCR